MTLDLVKLYEEFIEFHEDNFSEDVRSWLGVSELEISEEDIRRLFKMFYRNTFIEFCNYVRDIIYLKNPFDFIKETNKESWDLWYYISYLASRDLISIKNGKIYAAEELKSNLAPRYSRDEILRRLMSKVEIDDLHRPTSDLIKRLVKGGIEFKPHLDQMPISIESAITLISTIFRYYPFYDRFLFLGDDDFISVLIRLIEPSFKPIVVDLDERILNIIKDVDGDIEVAKRDFRREKRLDKEILGFCTNPPYNEEGIKTFLRYGLLHFDSLGGRVFLEFGDEAIGRKLLLLQRFFTRNNLEITDIVKGVINYPFMLMHPEDHIIREKLMNFFSKELIESGYMIGADIYVLTYIPWKVGRISIKGLKIYTYL
jgi:hypothetical protein